MKRWGKFNTLKERGEWVETSIHGCSRSPCYHVLKPYGDSLAYDVGIDHDGSLVRVQVKSSSVRSGTGYFCQFHRNYLSKHPYSLDELDLFATYVIPVQAWYLIPASVILKPIRKGRDAFPRRPPQEKPLPLRILQRSLAPPDRNPPLPDRRGKPR